MSLVTLTACHNLLLSMYNKNFIFSFYCYYLKTCVLDTSFYMYFFFFFFSPTLHWETIPVNVLSFFPTSFVPALFQALDVRAAIPSFPGAIKSFPFPVHMV